MATTSPFRSIERATNPPEPAGRVALLSGDPAEIASLRQMLERCGFAVFAAKSLPALQPLITAPTSSAVDVVLLDAGPSDLEDESAVSYLPQLLIPPAPGQASGPVVLLADPDRIAEAMQAVERGAYDVLIRPFSEQQLRIAVQRAIEQRRLHVQNNLFRHHLEQLIAARTQMLQNTMRQLEQSYDVTLEALGNALDLKDAETEGHSKRVTAYTLALGRAVGLNEVQLRLVGRGAFLHDIGKMAIPDAILRKPGKLTGEERAIMRTHSELGYRMVQKIPFLREAAEIVYAHQECYDGSGYPRGLRDEQIHIGARIFAVADTLDAMTSNRPYRKASTIAFARKEVLRCAGTQFDPAIVDVFMATPDSLWQDLREGILRDGPEFSPFSYTFGEISG